MKMKTKRIICGILSILIIVTTVSFSKISAANADYLNWKQFDPAWGDLLLGTSLLPMKNSGCMVTSMAIALYDLGYTEGGTFDPGKFVQKLNGNDGISEVGYYRWGAISKAIPGASEQIIQGNAIPSIKENMTLTKRVIVNVNKGGHWVFVKSVSIDETTLEVADVGSNKITTYPVSEVSRFMVIYYNQGIASAPGSETGTITIPTLSVTPGPSVTPTLTPAPTVAPTMAPTMTPIPPHDANSVIIIPTMNPEVTPTVTPEPTPKPTAKPTLVPTLTPTVKPTPVPSTTTIQSKSISLNLTTVYLKTTQGFQLKATVKPWNATDKRVLWKSENEQIVTVSKTGVIIAKKKGTAYVYAQSVDGKIVTKCKVIIRK